ncbi:MAG: NAD(+) synthase [Vampirovibrionales bacterium]|nr:NAD(+) synthase [Vampirovibrionales bacterium]
MTPLTALIAQTNPSPGDLTANARQLATGLREALRQDCNLFLAPELALMGYPIRDVIVRHPDLVQHQRPWLQALAEFTQDNPLTALIGFIEPRRARARQLWHEALSLPEDPLPESHGKPFYNAVAILQGGRLSGVVRKNLLATYQEYDDHRTFEACPQVGVAWVNNNSHKSPLLWLQDKKLAITICEDLWGDDTFFNPVAHDRNPIATIMQSGEADVLINLSASVSRLQKEALKSSLLHHVAKRYQRPIVYVNQCGAIDECSFDGQSRWVSASGEILHKGKAFVPDHFVIDINTPEAWASDSKSHSVQAVLPSQQRVYSPEEPLLLAHLHGSVTQGIADYFAKTGFKRAVIGLSGGLDSSVCAALLVDALGASNVLGVSMPSRITPADNERDTIKLAQNLGIELITLPIEDITQGAMAKIHQAAPLLEASWGKPEAHSAAGENIQAMSRATLLRLLGNQYRALPIATSDKSEFYMGYTTVNGDMSGALAPMGDIPKTQVRALGFWMNQEADRKKASVRVPESILNRAPCADLSLDVKTGSPVLAEAVMMPYAFIDEVIWRIEVLQQGLETMVQTPFDYERSYGALNATQKRDWLRQFYRRMNAALFKWWVAPPMIMVASHGDITKTAYHHPITACNINWHGETPDSARQKLHAP